MMGYIISFDDRLTPLDGDNELRNWIEMFGNKLLEEIPQSTKDEIIANVEKHQNLKDTLNNQEENRWIADYKKNTCKGDKHLNNFIRRV